MNFSSQHFSETNPSQEKKLFRKNAKDILKKITGDFQKIKQAENSVCENLTNDKIYKEADLILTFMPLKDEMPVLKITQKSISDKKSVFIPKIIPDSFFMTFHKIPSVSFLKNENAFSKENPFQILEPDDTWEELDISLITEKTLVLVPALLFSEKGERLGRGKGFYDRFLEKIAEKNAVLVGTTFSDCILPYIPTEKTDRKVQFILTEKSLFPTS